MEMTGAERVQRLPKQEHERLDRGHSLTFTFDGREFEGLQGDTIASALWASGQRTLSRSFKYHRPRGMLCASGDCPNCLVQIGDEPNVRACQCPVEEGLVVESQNSWPSLSVDAMRLVETLDRFLPVGFYYKAFMRPKALWPVYEQVLRRAAGLGAVDPNAEPWRSSHSYLHTDVTVVGGGPSGLKAALAATSCGAEVLLIDENERLGGHLLYRRWDGFAQVDEQRARSLVSAVEGEPRIRVLKRTNVIGAYDHNWIAAVDQGSLYKVRTGSLVVASGAIEIPLLFPGSDLPGVLVSGAAQRLMRLWGVRPGKRAVVVSPHPHGWSTALDLVQAGVDVPVVAVPHASVPEAVSARFRDLGLRIARQTDVSHADGGTSVEAVWLRPEDGGEPERVECDVLVVSAGFSPANGLLYQAGARFFWDANRNEARLDHLPEAVFAAGEVTGTHSLDGIVDEGERAGIEAALHQGFGSAHHRERLRKLAGGPATRKLDSAWSIPPVSSLETEKPFVCLCEDVTRADLQQSVEEGYDSAELLKRYSTVSMGPCQGKMCNPAVAQIAAHDTGRTVAEIGTTTSRPPIRPVRLGTLAGPALDPVRLTPMDAWHREQGAKMMVAGPWMRPEHYGDPSEEVRAVRERVGLIDVSTLGKFHLRGPDVPDLLERIYTNRWQKLDVGRVRYGVMVNEEGVVMDDGVTAHIDDDFYYMSATSSGAQSVYEWCEWWLQSGWDLDVHMLDATETRAAMNLAGPQARAVLRKVTTDVNLSKDDFPYMHVRQATVAGAPALLLRIGFTGELSYEIHTPSHYGRHVWQALMEAGEEFGIRPFGVEAQRVLRLEKGHLIVGQDTDSLSNALEAGMGWAVKMGKGDFIGRPSLKLAKSKGPARKLVGFEMPDGTLPEEADQIVREGEGPIGLEIIGRITSVRWSPTLEKVIGLAWLPPEMTEEGTPFLVRVDSDLQQGVVTDTPFYDPEGARLRA